MHQLVAAGEAFASSTVRRGEPAPDAVRALWKDELCALLELGELPRDEVERLLAAALGGPVDGRSVAALWELTRGNPLFLRELVRHGVDRGAARRGRRASGAGAASVTAGTRLAELVDGGIDALGAGARAACSSSSAVGGPLELGLLDRGGRSAALERARARASSSSAGADGRRRSVDVAHPLTARSVRARLTPHARSRRSSAARGRRRGARRAPAAATLLRLAVWRLESGAPATPQLFARAAEQALAAPTRCWPSARARRGQAGAGSARSSRSHGRSRRGRAAEAERAARGDRDAARDDGERAAVAIARARNLFWGLDRADDADAVLRDAERPWPTSAARRARRRSGSG